MNHPLIEPLESRIAPAALTISGATVFEGNSGTSLLTFTVTLDQSDPGTITVNYATADGATLTALDNATTAGGDYVAASGTLTFAPGEVTKTFDVTLNGDVTFEHNEVFTATLTNAAGATIATGTATGTIANDEMQPVISINDVSVIEGTGLGTPASLNFTVQLSNPSVETVQLSYATSDGTAQLSGNDYTSISQVLTFAPGETSKSVAIPVTSDSVAEADETLFVNLSSAMHATIGDGQGIGTILNDDAGLRIDNAQLTEGNLGATANMSFAVTLTGAQPNAVVTVDYRTQDGSALSTGTTSAGTRDFTTTMGTLTLTADASGNATGAVLVPVLGDAVKENTETFSTVLSNVSSGVALANSTATGTILDDDAGTVTISNATITEGNSGQQDAVFVVSLDSPAAGAVTVNFATQDGTAVSVNPLKDFLAKSGTLSFGPGESVKTIAVPIFGDLVKESTEQFTVKLTGATGVTILNDTGTGTIVDNGDPMPAASIAGGSIFEGASGTVNLPFTVTLSAPSQTPVTIDFTTQNGTATAADSDFATQTGTLTFAPGETQKTISVVVNGDAVNEANETVGVLLSNAQGATLGTTLATGTILNDDIAATIADQTFDEANATGTMTVTLSAAPVTGSTVTVNFAVAAGTATLNTDFKLTTPAVTSLTFVAGETTKTISFDIVGDLVDEADETFTVTLTSATGGVLGATVVGTGTIADNDAAPTLSIADAQITEGDAGTGMLTFIVSLSAASGKTVTVLASTVAGTALADTDFKGITDQLITFAPGQTSKTVRVEIVGDLTDEPTETFSVMLATPTNATIGDGTATGTILDNDQRALSISDASVAEGASGTQQLVFTLSIPSAAQQDITVLYNTANGTALAGTDYTAKSGSVTIPAGQTSVQVQIDVTGDAMVESDETLFVNLTTPTNATIADAQGKGTILADESNYKLVAVTDTSAEDDTTITPKTLVFKVVRAGDKTLPGTVTFATLDGTAISTGTRADFTAQSGTLNFAANETEKTITVTLRGDFAHEAATEQFQVRLTGSTNGVLQDAGGAVQSTLSATATITDNDAIPTVTISSPTVTEGNPVGALTTTDMVFTVLLSAPNDVDVVTVDFLTVDGTAHSTASGPVAADFSALTLTTLTFPKGTTTQTITVKVNRDTTDEAATETLTIPLSNVANATISPTLGTGTGTISDDDDAPILTFGGLLNGDVSATEGAAGETTASLTVKLSAASEQSVTVNVAALAGTATLNSDFKLPAGFPATLTFAPGETSKTLDFTILGDTTHEADESFSATLSQPANATIGDASATLTIVNDDPLPALAVNDVSIAEGNAGTTDLVFTVVLGGSSDQPVTVNYATSDGTARSTGVAPDYQATTGTLTFAPGETSKTISVPLIGDTIKEADETLTLTLSGATNALVADASGVGTILDDGDAAIGLVIGDMKIVEGDSGTKIGTFLVTLSAASTDATTFTVTTRNGTAVAGQDFVALKNQPFTIAAGGTTASVSVTINGDAAFESTESFFATVGSVSANVQLLDSEARGTIYNDDIQQLDAQTVRYVDEDGDLATVHISKGSLTFSGTAPVLTFGTANPIGGRVLQKIDFTNSPLFFNDSDAGNGTQHMDLFVTADAQPGFSASGGKSNGQVDVGFIQAGIPQGDLFQIFNNIDFRDITIEGDLGKIIVGDQVTDRAVQNLNILSHGARGTATGAPDNNSLFLAGIANVVVGGDWNGLLQSVGGDLGDIENLVIKGALRGGSATGSGQIFFTGTLINATIGSIIGGTGATSGAIFGNFTNDSTVGSGSSIGTVRVLGDIVGGFGANSGKILAPNIDTVIVGSKNAPGNLIGGAGTESGVIQAGTTLGKVIIKGNVIGGAERNTGEIFGGDSLGSVRVTGSMRGGAGDDSGSVVSGGAIASVTVLGNIDGGAGLRSGAVHAAAALTTFQLGSDVPAATGGNLHGGAGVGSGAIQVGTDFGSGVVFGNVVGGSGNNSGGFNVSGMLTNLEIKKNLEGGSSSPSGTSGGATTVSGTGFITASRIGTLLIDGDLKSGTNNGTSLAGSGTVRAAGDIASLVIGGNIVGNATTRVVIAAGGAAEAAKNQTIGGLVVKGGTAFADILGGYGGVSAANPLGDQTNADAQMGTIKFNGAVFATNVVAGIDAGVDGRFGTDDDEVISGLGVTDDTTVQSTIARLIVKGAVTPNTDTFGVVAQIITAAKIGTTSVVLNPTAQDDLELGPAGSKFRLRELPAA